MQTVVSTKPRPRDASEVIRSIEVLYVPELFETRVTFHAMRGTITDNGEVACVVAVKDHQCSQTVKPLRVLDCRGRAHLFNTLLPPVAAFFNVTHHSLVRRTRSCLTRNGFDD